MFSLLYGLFEYLFKTPEYQVLMVGLDRAGKTTLMERLKAMHSGNPGQMPSKILPTVGLNVGRVKVSGVEVVMRDLGGQPSLRSIWEKYFEESDAVMYVLDSADAERIEEAKACLEKLMAAEGLRKVPFIVMGNKNDLQGSMQVPELARRLECDTRGHPIEFHTISGFTGDGAQGLLANCITTIRTHRRANPNG